MTTATETTIDKPVPTRLYVALHKARQAMGTVAKGGENTFDRYRYATLADYIDAIQKPLDDNGLIIVSHIDEINWMQDRETKGGGFEKVCRIMLRTTVIHAESGESMSVTVLGEGQDRGDKAFYKADTGARKYALANLFNLATDDDPEQDRRPAEQEQQPAKRQSPAKSLGKTETPAPSAEQQELDKKKLQLKAMPLEKVLEIIRAAETVELLTFVVDGAEGGEAWLDLKERQQIIDAVRTQLAAVYLKVPASKRNAEVDNAFKAKMAKHKEKLDYDLEADRMLDQEAQQQTENPTT